MPAQAGIHLRSCWKAKKNLDSGPGSSPEQALRRNDERRRRLSVDKFNPLGVRPRAIPFLERQHNTLPWQNLRAARSNSPNLARFSIGPYLADEVQPLRPIRHPRAFGVERFDLSKIASQRS